MTDDKKKTETTTDKAMKAVEKMLKTKPGKKR